MSMSGIEIRSAFRKRSNRRSYSSGSTSVIRSAYETIEPAADPRPGTDRDPVVLRELDEVPDDQEVGREAHLLDHAQLHLEPLDGRRGRRVAVALAQPLRERAGAGTPPAPRPPAPGSAGSASCRARSRPRSARRSRAWWRSTPATRRTRRPSRPSPSNRTRSCRTRASARSACSSSARRAAPCGCRSPRGAGSARRRWPRAAGPSSLRHPHDPLVGLVLVRDPVLLDLEVDVLRRRRPEAARRRAARASCGMSSTIRRQKRDCRQPVRAMTPSE